MLEAYVTIELSAIQKAYEEACNMSTKPGYPKPKDDQIIDEDKSVRWNREEVKRLQEQYEEDRIKLRNNREARITIVEHDLFMYIQQEVKCTYLQAKFLWHYIYERYHHISVNDMFAELEELINLIDDYNDMKD